MHKRKYMGGNSGNSEFMHEWTEYCGKTVYFSSFYQHISNFWNRMMHSGNGSVNTMWCVVWQNCDDCLTSQLWLEKKFYTSNKYTALQWGSQFMDEKQCWKSTTSVSTYQPHRHWLNRFTSLNDMRVFPLLWLRAQLNNVKCFSGFFWIPFAFEILSTT